MKMHVSVDEAKCQGHNRCMISAPETFEVDHMGFAHVPEDKSEVADDRREAVEGAARNCPEMAIILAED